MSKILAIDPGTTESAWLVYDTGNQVPLHWAKEDNMAVLGRVRHYNADHLAIEMIASYGMAVGQEVFDTCVWVGRFYELWCQREDDRPDPLLVFRKQAKRHLCGTDKAKDTNIRAAIIDLYGPGKDKAVGLKASPGPLYGLKADCWAALAVAITAAETRL